MAAMRFLTLLHSTPESAPLLLDCEKAYDRVSHGWLDYCLTKSGFPSRVAQLLLNITASLHGRVITNNRLSGKFSINSGIRQGDPVAPVLFIITMEPLLVELTARGIGVQAHCDDTAVALTEDKVLELLEVLDLYERASGAKLNEGKSIIVSSKTINQQSIRPQQPTRKIPRILSLSSEEIHRAREACRRMHQYSGQNKAIASFHRWTYVGNNCICPSKTALQDGYLILPTLRNLPQS
jgi:hypothetical protein